MGASLFMIAIGVILKYTLPVSLAGVRLEVIGIVLMVAGALGLVLSLLIWGPRPRSGPGPRDCRTRSR
jgi:hypothetical protein